MRLADHSKRRVEASEACSNAINIGRHLDISVGLTTTGELGATSDKLEIAASGRNVIIRHNFYQFADGTTVGVEPMVGFQRF